MRILFIMVALGLALLGCKEDEIYACRRGCEYGMKEYSERSGCQCFTKIELCGVIKLDEPPPVEERRE